jgi:hypothetical protein
VKRARLVGRALARGTQDWPGMDATVVAYAGTAAGLFWHPDAQLFGLLAALVVGIAWYLSPARAWEARLRRRRAGQRS